MIHLMWIYFWHNKIRIEKWIDEDSHEHEETYHGWNENEDLHFWFVIGRSILIRITSLERWESCQVCNYLTTCGFLLDVKIIVGFVICIKVSLIMNRIWFATLFLAHYWLIRRGVTIFIDCPRFIFSLWDSSSSLDEIDWIIFASITFRASH